MTACVNSCVHVIFYNKTRFFFYLEAVNRCVSVQPTEKKYEIFFFFNFNDWIQLYPTQTNTLFPMFNSSSSRTFNWRMRIQMRSCFPYISIELLSLLRFDYKSNMKRNCITFSKWNRRESAAWISHCQTKKYWRICSGALKWTSNYLTKSFVPGRWKYAKRAICFIRTDDFRFTEWKIAFNSNRNLANVLDWSQPHTIEDISRHFKTYH